MPIHYAEGTLSLLGELQLLVGASVLGCPSRYYALSHSRGTMASWMVPRLDLNSRPISVDLRGLLAGGVEVSVPLRRGGRSQAYDTTGLEPSMVAVPAYVYRREHYASGRQAKACLILLAQYQMRTAGTLYPTEWEGESLGQAPGRISLSASVLVAGHDRGRSPLLPVVVG